MGAICIYPSKISMLVTYAHNHDRRPCKRWDTPVKSELLLLPGGDGLRLPGQGGDTRVVRLRQRIGVVEPAGNSTTEHQVVIPALAIIGNLMVEGSLHVVNEAQEHENEVRCLA